MTAYSTTPAQQIKVTAPEFSDLGGDHIWLPYAQMKTARPPLLVNSTEGCRINLADGRSLIDGIASWWTACHGYNHPHILKTIRDQLARMPHIMFGGLTHEPALRLARRLAKITPGDLSRVFFSESGSVAVEVALKMALQYWHNQGDVRRTKILSFHHAYHGDTLACMALSDPDQWIHAGSKGLLPSQPHVKLPSDEESTAALEKLFEKEGSTFAAAIIEPLVQGAGGMRFHDAGTLKRLAELCARHKVLLIADEIFTGFGRTGSMFACEQADIVPDILCLGKALSGGAITLAATIARPSVFAAFWSDENEDALMHGTTFMANPLACAAAHASLDLFESEPRLAEIERIEEGLKKGLHPAKEMPGVLNVRIKGAIGVVQLSQIKDMNKLKKALLDKGVWVRPFDDIIYLTPSFTIRPDELAQLTDAVCSVLAEEAHS